MVLGFVQWVLCFYLLRLLGIRWSVFEWLYSLPWIGATIYLAYTEEIYSALAYSFFGTILFLCATIDWHYMILPDEGAMLLLLGAVGIHLERSTENIFMYVCASVGLGAFLYALRYFSGGGVGLGDVKYAAVLGLWVLPDVAATMLGLAFILGAMYAIVLKIWHQSPSLLPFGPFLCVSGGLCYLWGEVLKEGIYTLNYWWE